MRRLSVAFALSIATGAPDAQERSHEAVVSGLRATATALAKSGDFAGEILFAYQGRVLYHEALGTLNPLDGTPAKVGDLYNIASVGKVFTGAAVFQMIASGKLTLDDTLGRFLPESIGPRSARSAKLRHVLSHTSGVRRGSDTTVFAPGTRFEYTNFGYYLLGEMIGAMTKLPFEEHYRRTIFAPLGMAATMRYVPGAGKTPPPPGFAVSRNAAGERVFQENRELQTTPATGAGGFYSTADDLFRFVEALRLGKIVPSAWVDSMRTPKTNLGAADYGYAIDRYRGGTIWGLTGFIPGANADVELYGDSGYVLIVLSNRAANEPIRQLVAASLGREPFTHG